MLAGTSNRSYFVVQANQPNSAKKADADGDAHPYRHGRPPLVRRFPVTRAQPTPVRGTGLGPPREVDDEDDEQNDHEEPDHSITCPCDGEHVFLLRRCQTQVPIAT
jgi:hypothetical protein